MRGERWYGAAFAGLAATAVLVLFAYFAGATTLVACQGTNPFDRFGLWIAQGSHVDGNGGPSCIVPHPFTWVVVVVLVGTGLGLVGFALRRH